MKLLKFICVCVCTMVTCSTILSTAGCKSHPALERIVRDTVRLTKTVYIHDTVFKTPAASVNAATRIKDPQVKKELTRDLKKPLSKSFKNATATAKMKGDSLIVNCKCDTLAIKAKLKETFEQEYHSNTETDKDTVQVKYVPGIVKFFAWCGGLFWALLIGFSAYKIYKLIKK